MKRRVARLLEEEVKPETILAVTFTRVAAEDRSAPRAAEVGRAWLRRTRRAEAAQPRYAHSRAAERPRERRRNATAAQQLRAQGHVFGHRRTHIGKVIPYLVQYLKENPAADEHSEFEHVLADEYQDLNKAEQTATAYQSEGANICVVGDDDQSIYSFKHTHPDGIREWKTIHAGCSDFEMAECQRCPTMVVEMANSLINCNVKRSKRELKLASPVIPCGESETQNASRG